MTASRRLSVMWIVTAIVTAGAMAEAGAPPAGTGGDWRKELDKAVRSRDVEGATRIINAALARRLPGADKGLAEAFKSPNVWIRRAALRGIVALPGPLTIEMLVQGLGDPNPLVRLDASLLAGRIPAAAEGANRLADALLESLADERRPRAGGTGPWKPGVADRILRPVIDRDERPRGDGPRSGGGSAGTRRRRGGAAHRAGGP